MCEIMLDGPGGYIHEVVMQSYRVSAASKDRQSSWVCFSVQMLWGVHICRFTGLDSLVIYISQIKESPDLVLTFAPSFFLVHL